MLHVVEVTRWDNGKVDVHQRTTDKKERNISKRNPFSCVGKRVFKTKEEADIYAQTMREQNEKTE